MLGSLVGALKNEKKRTMQEDGPAKRYRTKASEEAELLRQKIEEEKVSTQKRPQRQNDSCD